MLPPDNRAVLRELLKPPIGSELAQAVGTTFTVDLTSALVIPMSFAARDLGEGSDPIGVMEAIRSCSDRVDVFYQAGKASVPATASDLMAFLEPVLHPVAAPRPGHLFHPKVWVLKFIDVDQGVSYRLICGSRNLTQDRSWDAVIALDGTPGTRVYASNSPIRTFLRRLPQLSIGTLAAERLERIDALAEEVGRVRWEAPEHAKDPVFHALGIGNPTRIDFSGYRRLVVSPFVNDAGIAIVAPPTARGTVLVSRPEEINRLSTTTDGTDLRVLSTLAELEDDAETTDLSGLHAKIVIVERDRSAHMFIGSANATDAAYQGNVEFLVEIERGASKYGVDQHLAIGTGMGSLLEEYMPQPPTDTTEDDLRFVLQDLLRRIAEMPWTVHVTPQDDSYRLTADVGKPIPAADAELRLGLVTRHGYEVELTPTEMVSAEFANVPTADITCFLTLAASSGGLRESTVIPAQLIGDPEGRLDAVLARQVDTPENFLRFLMMLLGLDIPGIGEASDSTDGSTWKSFLSGQGIFELLARALADDSRALTDLDRLVDRLAATDDGRSRMPEGFLSLWETVTEARAGSTVRL